MILVSIISVIVAILSVILEKIQECREERKLKKAQRRKGQGRKGQERKVGSGEAATGAHCMDGLREGSFGGYHGTHFDLAYPERCHFGPVKDFVLCKW